MEPVTIPVLTSHLRRMVAAVRIGPHTGLTRDHRNDHVA